jgi:NTP pyrophosphatase (non-canonical NTP hydrolase)
MTLNQLKVITKRATRKFPGKKWRPEIRTLDLVEEVGELCNAVLIKEGHKGKKRTKGELADSIVDILFDLILIADNYRIDIGKEYFKMIKDIIRRQKEKQFN